MTAKELFAYALDQATAVVVQVESGQMRLPTPDTEWDVEALLRHMMYELAWVPDMVGGKTVAEVGTVYDGDLLGDDWIGSWRERQILAEKAVDGAGLTDPVHVSYGDITVEDYLWEVGNDLLIHGWDLGQGIGVSVVFDEAAAQVLYDRAVARQDELAGSGLFAPPVPVPATANVQTKLLAALGRSENWVDARR